MVVNIQVSSYVIPSHSLLRLRQVFLINTSFNEFTHLNENHLMVEFSQNDKLKWNGINLMEKVKNNKKEEEEIFLTNFDT